MISEEQLEIVRSFSKARRQAKALDGFPGDVPKDLASAYTIQDTAIDLWPDEIKGWKVGRIPEHLEEGCGIDRLAGPMFANVIHNVSDKPFTMPVFAGGFGAVEAEYLVVIKRDAEVGKMDWSLEESLDMIGDLRIGIEMASSPLSTINQLGPNVVVSDFGNNSGLMVGPSIADWASRDLDSLHCETFIEGQSTGTGGAFTLTGGYLRSTQFMLTLAAQRGRPLKAGSLIATGQTNGIHEVLPGQRARVNFGQDGELNCDVVAAVPMDATE